MAELRTYYAKRDFSKTPEPRGAVSAPKGKRLRFVIQKHAASRLHYDLRLELDGVMLSWAVTKGPSLIPGEKRLAVHVEDHPIEYNKFEGTIPQGEYGGGTVMIWDKGEWIPEGDPRKGLKKGHLDFRLEGEKLHGRWHLVRMRKRPGEKQEAWLLIKATDEFARKDTDPDILEEKSRSVVSGRSIEEIATGKSKVWHSNRPAKDPLARLAPAKPAAESKTATRKVKTTPTPARKAKTSEPRPRSRAPRSKAAAAPKKAGAKKKTKAGTALSVDVSKIAGTRKAAMPDFVPPELATLSDVAPGSGDWVHEIKFDGYRIQARIDGDAITLKTRTGLDWTDRFSPIAEACTGFGPHAVLLDGEIVSGDENGVSDFSALQDDLKTGRYDRLAYYVFDILHLDGYDLTGAALIDRKQVLYDLFAEAPGGSVIRASEHFETDGSVMLDHACQMQLEGIVSKRRNAPYRSGRSGDWLKVKCANAQEFVIAGYEPSDKNSRAIRSLLLAYYDKDGLRYAGRVGTGWGEAKERDLSRRLAEVAADKPPFDKVPEEERRRKVKWVEPKLVAEVEFRGWTGGKLLRQASFKGLREDKPAREVVREVSGMSQTKQAALRQKTPVKKAAEKGRRATPAAPAKAPSRATSKNEVTVAGVKLTHPERMYWEDAGITKEDLAKYYEKVWDWMAPHVTNRVVALVRCPEGATAECFFQKHASAGLMEKRLHMVAEPDGDKAISVDDLPGVISLVQAGVLEIHTRGSTIEHLEEADRLVFDLDPGPGIEFKDIAEAAREVRDGLRALELESFLKNTGGKGLHVVLPIEPTPWDPAKEFCRRFAEGLARLRPDRYTTTIKKTARNNKIFIDYLRNSREATAIAPYSTRARPGATVSVPLIWEELRTLKIPNPFTVQNLPKRLAKLRKDPWEGIGKLKQHLPDLSKLK